MDKENINRQSVRDILRVARNIEEGHYTSAKVKRKLKMISRLYDSPFLPYEPDRKDPPWDIDYLKELGHSVPFGAISPEYLLYMAEVADEVYRPQRRRRRHRIFGALAILVLLACLAAFIVDVFRR